MSRTLEALWLRVHEARMAQARPDLSVIERASPDEVRAYRPASWATPGPKGQPPHVIARMHAMCEAGETVRDIATHFGLSERQVGRILNRGRE